jgi:hypothetical protein
MNRLVVITAIMAVLVGGLAEVLWQGGRSGRLESELRDAETRADHLAQELDAARTQSRRLAAELQTIRARVDAAERDLRAEQGISSRLHLLVSQGKK